MQGTWAHRGRPQLGMSGNTYDRCAFCSSRGRSRPPENALDGAAHDRAAQGEATGGVWRLPKKCEEKHRAVGCLRARKDRRPTPPSKRRLTPSPSHLCLARLSLSRTSISSEPSATGTRARGGPGTCAHGRARAARCAGRRRRGSARRAAAGRVAWRAAARARMPRLRGAARRSCCCEASQASCQGRNLVKCPLAGFVWYQGVVERNGRLLFWECLKRLERPFCLLIAFVVILTSIRLATTIPERL